MIINFALAISYKSLNQIFKYVKVPWSALQKTNFILLHKFQDTQVDKTHCAFDYVSNNILLHLSLSRHNKANMLIVFYDI